MRQKRWIELLSDYECKIKYHPVKANVVADSLSRKERLKPRRVRAMSITIHSGLKTKILEAQGEASKDLKGPAEWLRGLETYFERQDDGGIYFFDLHPSADKMYYDLRDLYWWHGMKGDIVKYISRCLTCSKIKAEHQKPSGLLQQPEIPELTKSAHFLPIREDYKTKKLARIYINEIVARHGVSVSIISDRDGRFASHALQEALVTIRALSAHHSLYGQKCRSPVIWTEVGESQLIRPEIMQEMKEKIIQIKERLNTARSRQKSYADKGRKPLELKVRDRVLIKVSSWKGVELSSIHDTFHVSNLKKCLTESDVQVPLEEIGIDENLHFVEEPIETVERDVKKLNTAGTKVYAAGLQPLEELTVRMIKMSKEIRIVWRTRILTKIRLGSTSEFESAQSNTTAKLPILKLDEYEMWVIRIKQYFQVQDYALWEVIENVPVTAEEKTNKKNDVKARSLLLMALPNEHQLTFSHASSTESLDSIFNRFQKIVSKLAIFGVVISQEDLNSNFLSSLPPEWNTYVVVWMNKAKIETMGIDDLYNNFKIVKQKVRKSVGASSGAQNLAFMTALSTSSTNDVNTAIPAYEVSTASPNVNTASPQVSTASFSDNAVYAFMIENPNVSNLLQQDLEQIHEDDLEAVDLKWQLSLLSMRAKRYYQRIGKKIFINANDTAGYDKSKVECFNCHKMGHFARECRAPRNKEG
ncbi:putative reverse transcriptase domain-containing protein [Tanacetum coccineum]